MDSLDDIDRPVIVYDGDCPLCRAVVASVLKSDRAGRFRFAAAQSRAGQEVQDRLGVYAVDEGTLLYIDSGRVLRRSSAVLEIARRLGGWTRILYAGRILPRPLRDWLYRIVARHRYRLFRSHRQ